MTKEELPQFGNFEQLKGTLTTNESNASANFHAVLLCLAKLRSKFLARTREEWESVFSDLDACVTPVLELDEAPKHPHNQHRNAFAVNSHGQMDPVSSKLHIKVLYQITMYSSL